MSNSYNGQGYRNEGVILYGEGAWRGARVRVGILFRFM